MLYMALVFYAGAGRSTWDMELQGREIRQAPRPCDRIGFIANTLSSMTSLVYRGTPPILEPVRDASELCMDSRASDSAAEKFYGIKIIGSVTMPLAVVSVILMQLMPSEVRPLVPALQSTWLHVHVSLAMLSMRRARSALRWQ